MRANSSYQPLADYLADKEVDSWEASFREVEHKLGRELPQSAYRHQAWWANQSGPGHSQTHGWRSVGWRTSKLDLERRRVRFERERPISRPPPVNPRMQNNGSPTQAELIEQAMAISGIADREAVISGALRNFVEQEAVRGAIELGGSMPDFEAAPRKRPWG